MRSILPYIFIIFTTYSCTSERTNTKQSSIPKVNSLSFSQILWLEKSGEDYPYRNGMVKDIISNDSIRTLSKKHILSLLGSPDYDRNNEHYLYYIIYQKRILSWPLHTKSLVFKFSDRDEVEWKKVHE